MKASSFLGNLIIAARVYEVTSQKAVILKIVGVVSIY